MNSRSNAMRRAMMVKLRSNLAGRNLANILGLAIMLVRGWIYCLVRLRLPRLILMDRGARIQGIGNVRFGGPIKLGMGAVIDARWCSGVTLGRNISVGDYSIIRCSGSPTHVCPGVSIGDRTSFGPYCNIGGGYGLKIGSDCLFGPYVSVHPEYHVTESVLCPIRDQGISGEGIQIGDDNWFGAKSTVLDGAILGDGNIVAACALLRKGHLGSRATWAGIPAREVARR